MRLRWKLRFQEKEEDWLRIAQMSGLLIVTFQEYLLFILLVVLDFRYHKFYLFIY